MAFDQQFFRDFVINGECMVYVRGNGALGSSTTGDPQKHELGLTADGVQIYPQLYHDPVHTSQHGDKVQVETRWKLASCEVHMKLVHFNRDVLRACIQESTAAPLNTINDPDSTDIFTDGWVGPAGSFLGGGKQLWESGCHYVSVGVTSPVDNFPWRFPASYLMGPPLLYPIGTESTVAELRWKVIPYQVPYQANQPTTGPFSGQGRVRGELFGVNGYNRNGELLLGSGYLVWDHYTLTDDPEVIGG